MEKLICEAIDVARAEGHNFSYYQVLNMVHSTCEKIASGYTSMSQDVMNCRKTEIDCINGYVVSQAKKYNISTPYNELVLNLVHAIENTYQYQEMPLKKFEANTVILKAGQENSNLYKIIHGKAEVYFHYGEKDEYLIGILHEGQCFGETSALIEKKEPMTTVAFSDCIVMEIPKANHRQFISLNPENAVDMLKMLAQSIDRFRLNAELILDERNPEDQRTLP